MSASKYTEDKRCIFSPALDTFTEEVEVVKSFPWKCQFYKC